jgi:hypothetical protein
MRSERPKIRLNRTGIGSRECYSACLASAACRSITWYSGRFGPKSRSWVQAHAMTDLVIGRRLSPLRMTYAAPGLFAPAVHRPTVALADAALAFAQPPRAQSPCWRSARPVSKAALRARRAGGASITFGRGSLARGSSWPPLSRSQRAPLHRPSAAPGARSGGAGPRRSGTVARLRSVRRRPRKCPRAPLRARALRPSGSCR